MCLEGIAIGGVGGLYVLRQVLSVTLAVYVSSRCAFKTIYLCSELC
jgi:hypothetical protein